MLHMSPEIFAKIYSATADYDGKKIQESVSLLLDVGHLRT